MAPYAAYLVYGYIRNSLSGIIANASLVVETSIGNKKYNSDSDGIYLFDLAEIGYVTGETIKINVTGPFNNEFKEHTFVVSGVSNNEDITLAVRTLAVNTTGYSPKSSIHTVGDKPVTSENLFPTQANVPNYEQRRSKVAGTMKTEYIGEGEPGLSASVAKWRIKKIIYDGNFSTGTLWANGTDEFDKKWDDRTSYTYGDGE